MLTFQNHVWLASVLKPIFPLLNESDSQSLSHTYTELLNRYRHQSPFFQKYYDSYQEYSDDTLLNELLTYGASLVHSDQHVQQNQEFHPLKSVFTTLFNQKETITYQYPSKPLQLANLLPQTKEDSSFSIDLIMSNLNREIIKVEEEEQLYHLLEKYFWSVSSSQSRDISLFDEMKATAAITVSIYKELVNREDRLKQMKRRFAAEDEHLLLIHGDISGIQNFIFQIPSKGAAKSLKGRSIYINLLSDLIVRYILDEFSLPRTNLLYRGGGNFFILVPFSEKQRFYELRNQIARTLLDAHDGEIYYAIDVVPVKLKDFKDFSGVWQKAKERVHDLKKRKWSELDLQASYSRIFGPLDEGKEEKEICNVCGSFGKKRSLRKIRLEDQDTQVCTLCYSFIELTDELKDARYISFERVAPHDGDYDYQNVFSQFGYHVQFSSKVKTKGKQQFRYALNDTQFLERGCHGFYFGAFELPHHNGKQLTFKELSDASVRDGIGDSKLSYLKLDVDNLGSMFGEGLGENRSISRVAVLSRMLKLYFEGYIHYLLEKKQWKDKIYVVFSGGDDTFVVGSWRHVFEFAQVFYKDFRQFTCHNPYVTFSAGINVFPYQFPIMRAADLTENALDKAKSTSPQLESLLPPIKNKLSFLGEVFNWEEFKSIKHIQQILVRMVNKQNRSILYKVQKSTLGFKQILKESNQGKFRNIRFWRLAYYLREAQSDDVEELIEQYRKIVIHNLFGEGEQNIQQIMIIPAAVKWAELSTRKEREDEHDRKAGREVKVF